MSNINTLYPFLFHPNLHSMVWGGERISEYKHLPSQDFVGESWEVSVIPYSTSTIANGDLAGRNLADVIAENPVEILGEAVAAQYQNKLPLLAKFIDAKHDLSIQVHPNDEMARMKYGKLGKSEMWYIIDAEPGSFLYAGFNREISLEEYHQRISDGTFCEVLAKHEVKKGDVFYLPAGRVHAICGGIMLTEIQQSTIYRQERPTFCKKSNEILASHEEVNTPQPQRGEIPTAQGFNPGQKNVCNNFLPISSIFSIILPIFAVRNIKSNLNYYGI